MDGVVAALMLLEGMVGYGVRTSKFRTYATPARKELVNLPEIFDEPYVKEG